MSQSQELFNRAKQHIPGGVNSPVRAFKGELERKQPRTFDERPWPR